MDNGKSWAVLAQPIFQPLCTLSATYTPTLAGHKPQLLFVLLAYVMLLSLLEISHGQDSCSRCSAS